MSKYLPRGPTATLSNPSRRRTYSRVILVHGALPSGLQSRTSSKDGCHRSPTDPVGVAEEVIAPAGDGHDACDTGCGKDICARRFLNSFPTRRRSSVCFRSNEPKRLLPTNFCPSQSFITSNHADCPDALAMLELPAAFNRHSPVLPPLEFSHNRVTRGACWPGTFACDETPYEPNGHRTLYMVLVATEIF